MINFKKVSLFLFVAASVVQTTMVAGDAIEAFEKELASCLENRYDIQESSFNTVLNEGDVSPEEVTAILQIFETYHQKLDAMNTRLRWVSTKNLRHLVSALRACGELSDAALFACKELSKTGTVLWALDLAEVVNKDKMAKATDTYCRVMLVVIGTGLATIMLNASSYPVADIVKMREYIAKNKAILDGFETKLAASLKVV